MDQKNFKNKNEIPVIMFKEVFKELLSFLLERKKFLIPIVILLFLIGAILVFSLDLLYSIYLYFTSNHLYHDIVIEAFLFPRIY